MKVRWRFANASDSRLEQSLYYRKALNPSTMDQKLLCVRQSGKSPYHISISPVLIIKNVVEFRQYCRMSSRYTGVCPHDFRQLASVRLANFQLLIPTIKKISEGSSWFSKQVRPYWSV